MILQLVKSGALSLYNKSLNRVFLPCNLLVFGACLCFTLRV